MSESKTAGQHGVQPASGPSFHGHPVDFNSYLRRCLYVFITALCAIALMIWASFLPQEHFSWAEKIAIILTIACCNAFVVAGFLMHLISERKMVYTILGFTASFVIGLFTLTLYAMNDFPRGTITH